VEEANILARSDDCQKLKWRIEIAKPAGALHRRNPLMVFSPTFAVDQSARTGRVDRRRRSPRDRRRTSPLLQILDRHIAKFKT
jgi:hypothetical protein